MDRMTRSKPRLLVWVSLVCSLWLTGCGQPKPSRTLSYDETVLWSFVTDRRSTELQKKETSVLLNRLQSVGVSYKACPPDLKESLHLETLRLSPCDIRMALPIVVCGTREGKPRFEPVWLDDGDD